MKTIGLLNEATRRLREAGVDAPRLTAELLLAHAGGIDRAHLLTLDDVAAPDFERMLDDAAHRVPIAYLTGSAESYGLPLEVAPGVFIPRPCTDGLIERALEDLPDGARACDLGTGSGNIAVALAYHRRKATVTAVDISGTALRFARRNAARNGVAVSFVRGDLLAWTRARFDLIVSNPPYVESPRDVAPEVRHEPPESLYGGLTVIRRLAETAPAHLKPGGRLFLEFGHDQAENVKRILRSGGAFRDIRVFPDLEGIPRLARAVCG